MAQEDRMPVVFANGSQRLHFQALENVNMYPGLYIHSRTMTTLEIKDCILFMLNELGWENFAINRKYQVYKRLTLEFLSSFYYNPNVGLGHHIGVINFRLFGVRYSYTEREITRLLGFLFGPNVHVDSVTHRDTDENLKRFWASISGSDNVDPELRISDAIHNPAIRYMQKYLEKEKMSPM